MRLRIAFLACIRIFLIIAWQPWGGVVVVCLLKKGNRQNGKSVKGMGPANRVWRDQPILGLCQGGSGTGEVWCYTWWPLSEFC